MQFYSSLFEKTGVHKLDRYDRNENQADGTVKFAMFLLAGQTSMAADSNLNHYSTFESISCRVNCESYTRWTTTEKRSH